MAFNNEDILVLAKAGFTAEQIAALNSAVKAPEVAAPAPAPKAAPAPAPKAAPAPAPEVAAPAPAPEAPATAAPHSVDDVLKAISGLTTSIQNANLLQTQMPTEQKTAETILASIINPPTKKGGITNGS